MRGGRRPPGSNDSCAVANVMSLRVIPMAHKAVEGGKIPYCLRFMVKVQGI